jgi:hypothetical protein
VNFAGEVFLDTIFARLEESPWAEERRRLREARESTPAAKKRKKKRKKPIT